MSSNHTHVPRWGPPVLILVSGTDRVRAGNDRASERDAHRPTGTGGVVLNGLNAVLATIPSPDRGVWYLGPLPLRAYALCIIAGIIVAIWWGERRWVARGGLKNDVTDIAVW